MRKKRRKTAATDVRKQARQARARATVEAILEATAHILVERGYAGLTTNHVAARAGVSIGSVYQYFPSKEAIVAALVDRHLERMWVLVGSELARSVEEPFPAATRRIISALIRANQVDAPLQRAVLDLIPTLERAGEIRDIDRQIESLLCTALEARGREVEVSDARLCAFVCVQSVKAVTLCALLERPEFSAERLADELARMVVRYAGRYRSTSRRT
jgi:AcrR family transcriptional regulator